MAEGIQIDSGRITEILGGLKHIVNTEIERHGANPTRHYEMLHALAMLAASMIVAAPNPGAEREGFIGALDRYITQVTQNVQQ